MRHLGARLRPAPGADRAAPARAARRRAPARLRPRDAARCGTGTFARPAGPARRRTTSSSSTTRASCRRGCAPARPSGGAAEVLLARAGGDGAWEALARPSRRLAAGDAARSRRARSSSSSASGGGRWLRPARAASRAGEAPLPPYIHEPLPTRSATRRSTRTSRARPPRRPPACTSRRSSCAPARRRAVTLHVGLDTFRPVADGRLEDARASTASATGVDPAAWERIAAAPPRVRRRRHDDRARARDARRAAAPRAGRTDALHHAGLRVPAASTRC